MPITNRQQKIAKLKDSGDLVLFKEIERLEETIPNLDKVLSSVKGNTNIINSQYVKTR